MLAFRTAPCQQQARAFLDQTQGQWPANQDPRALGQRVWGCVPAPAGGVVLLPQPEGGGGCSCPSRISELNNEWHSLTLLVNEYLNIHELFVFCVGFLPPALNQGEGAARFRAARPPERGGADPRTRNFPRGHGHLFDKKKRGGLRLVDISRTPSGT